MTHVPATILAVEKQPVQPGKHRVFVRILLRKYRGSFNTLIRGLLFELGHVAGRARESLKAYGVEGRCSVIEGNFFESVPSGADTYLFRHIIHDWTDEQSVQILKNCRKVIPKNGRLLIVEAVVPPGNEPSLAKDFDMVMLVLPGGIERTEEEYRLLFKQAGFQLSSITPTTSLISVVEGKPI